MLERSPFDIRRTWIVDALQAVVARISADNDNRLAPAPGLELTQLEDRFMLSASPLPVEVLVGADVGDGGGSVTTDGVPADPTTLPDSPQRPSGSTEEQNFSTVDYLVSSRSYFVFLSDGDELQSLNDADASEQFVMGIVGDDQLPQLPDQTTGVDGNTVSSVRQDLQANVFESSEDRQRAAQQTYLEQVRSAQQDVLSAVQAEYQDVLRMNVALDSAEFSQYLDNSNLTSAEKDRLTNSYLYFSVMSDLAQGIVDGDVDAVKTTAPRAFEAETWAPWIVEFADAEGYAMLPHLWAIPEDVGSLTTEELQTTYDDIYGAVGDNPSDYFETIQNDAADNVLSVQASMRQVNVDLKMLQYQFPFFDATLFRDGPDMQAEFGMSPIQMVYSRALWDPGALRDQPDEAKVREVARGLSADQFTVVDIEVWKTHIGVTSEVAAESMDKLVKVMDWMHEENPNLMIGYYSVAPSADWPAALRPGSGRWDRLTARNDELQTVADAVDIIFPSLYTFSQNPDWDVSAANLISEARQYGKAVIPFIWAQYHPNSELNRFEYFPVEMWELQLETLKEHADGIIYWTDKQPWTGDYDWIEPTRSFIEGQQRNDQPVVDSGTDLVVGASTGDSEVVAENSAADTTDPPVVASVETSSAPPTEPLSVSSAAPAEASGRTASGVEVALAVESLGNAIAPAADTPNLAAIDLGSAESTRLGSGTDDAGIAVAQGTNLGGSIAASGDFDSESIDNTHASKAEASDLRSQNDSDVDSEIDSDARGAEVQSVERVSTTTGAALSSWSPDVEIPLTAQVGALPEADEALLAIENELLEIEILSQAETLYPH